MSYILEALQRAEAERSGGSPPKNGDSVVDLLQGVEQEIARAQSQGQWTGGDLPKSVNAIANPPLAVAEVAHTPPVAGAAPAEKADSPETPTFADAKVLSPGLKLDSRLICLTDQ